MFSLFKKRSGFTLSELIIALLLASLLTAAAYNFFKKQERKFVVEKLSGDVKSLSRIAFFLIGRDIRRAGSNPSQGIPQGIGGGATVPIFLPIAQPEKIQILADLNADDDTNDTDEDITYEYIDSDGDGQKDQIKRDPTSGDLVVINNVENFRLTYVMASGAEEDEPTDISLIRKVKIQMTVNAGRNNPETGEPITQTFESTIKLRNFQ